MDLRFEGELGLIPGIALAMIAAFLVWWMYRRELVSSHSRMITLLPVIRALTIILIVLMLIGPVIHGRVQVGDLSRVLLFVDDSQSMALADESMSPDRKLRFIHQMGWIPQDSIDTSTAQMANRLSTILAQQVWTSPSSDRKNKSRSNEIRTLLDELREIQNDLDGIDHLTPPRRRNESDDESGIPERFQSTVIDPISGLLSNTDENDSFKPELLDSVRDSLEDWRDQLNEAWMIQVEALLTDPPQSVSDALSRYEESSRWQRVAALLAESEQSLLPILKDHHHVELISTSNPGETSAPLHKIWETDDGGEFPSPLLQEPESKATDLTHNIALRVAQHKVDQHLSVVLLSDGHHNDVTAETAPLQLARVFADRGVPIYSIGIGTEKPPIDLAVIAVNAPESVFVTDRVKGEIVVKDHIEVGQQYAVTISIDENVIWTKKIESLNSSGRSIPFDFQIEELVDRKLSAQSADFGADAVTLPLQLEIEIEPLESETRSDNNSLKKHVRAVTRPRKLLIIDSRSRWEFRYVRNMFDRDEQWDVNDIIIDSSWSSHPKMERGGDRGEFPTDRKDLFAYDLIVLGDVPAKAFQSEELTWISQFVSTRGGGLIFIDGQRLRLQSFLNTDLAPLLPIQWTDKNDNIPGLLSLTPRGHDLAALQLDSEEIEEVSNWTELPTPKWIAAVESLPGTETLINARVSDSITPALVQRRFGAGTVLYSAHDESWRWRYEVADKHHSRYWHQIASWVMEPPYAVHDQFVSIDTGGFSYQEGQAAQFNVRLRDDTGRPITDTDANLLILRDSEVVKSLPMLSDGDSSGVLRARTDGLEPGMYDVRVEATGFSPDQLKAQAQFAVLGDPHGELTVLNCNEELLQEVSLTSGGQYFREEEALAKLPNELRQFSDGRIEERETMLWRSWLWFVPLVILFSLEWTIRRKTGLI